MKPYRPADLIRTCDLDSAEVNPSRGDPISFSISHERCCCSLILCPIFGLTYIYFRQTKIYFSRPSQVKRASTCGNLRKWYDNKFKNLVLSVKLYSLSTARWSRSLRAALRRNFTHEQEYERPPPSRAVAWAEGRGTTHCHWSVCRSYEQVPFMRDFHSYYSFNHINNISIKRTNLPKKIP